MLDRMAPGTRAWVKELLDEYHAEARPQRYYDILVGYWLLCLAHAMVLALRSEPDAQPLRPAAVSVPVFPDENEFIDCVLRKPGLHDVIRAALAPTASDLIAFAADKTVFACGDARRGWRRLLHAWFARLGNSEGVLVCAPYAKCSTFAWLRFVVAARSVMRWDDLQRDAAFEVTVDHEWRLKKFRASRGDAGDLSTAIKRLVPLLIPVVYLEGLRPLRQIAGRLKIGRPQAFYTANALYHHPLFKLLAAEHEQSTLLLGHQHGGGFGTDLRHPPEEYERSVCDFFYTWGWGDAASTRPLSPPAFARYRKRKHWKLLLCLGDFPLRDYRIQFFPAGPAAERTIQDTLEFAGRIAATHEHGRAVLIRPPPAEYRHDWIDVLRRALPASRIDAGGKRAMRRFAESELVFHNYLSTGWLESLWLDVPTFAIYDPDVYAFRDEVMPYMKAFERYGLLHPSGVSAGQLCARIQDDVVGWWNQTEFRSVRIAFAERYVRVRGEWQREWIREFQWLLANRAAIIARRQQPQITSTPRDARKHGGAVI